MSILAASAGGSAAVGPTSGSKTYAYNNLSTTPETVANPNYQRVSITFHNPGAIGVYIFPTLVQNTNSTAPNPPPGSDTVLTPSPTALGGCFYVYPLGGQITFTGENQKAWGAFSASGSGNPLTVSESNQ
jgi:hypothetical protein